MKMRGFRKLDYFQILKVVQTSDDVIIELQPISRCKGLPVPDGCFMMTPEGILLPKRKKNSEFKILYTTLHEKTF